LLGHGTAKDGQEVALDINAKTGAVTPEKEKSEKKEPGVMPTRDPLATSDKHRGAGTPVHVIGAAANYSFAALRQQGLQGRAVRHEALRETIG
jgi:hypothetical protein